MKINPCPNPTCKYDLMFPPTVDAWSSNYNVRGTHSVSCHICKTSGPVCDSEPAAIAAWNSISMGGREEIDRLRYELQRANEAGESMRRHYDSVKHQLDHLVNLIAEGRALHGFSVITPIPPTPEGK